MESVRRAHRISSRFWLAPFAERPADTSSRSDANAVADSGLAKAGPERVEAEAGRARYIFEGPGRVRIPQRAASRTGASSSQIVR